MRKILSMVLVLSILVTLFLPGTVAAAPNYNYGEALQKAIMFYEFQRSGALPADKRDNWRADSGLSDGADVGLNLTGGWYDAGDHVKFNLPMAYSAAMLAWSVYEDREALKSSGQLDYLLADIKWVTDYLIKCHPSANEFYYQVGDGGADHAWWGPAEVMQMSRPSYKLDLTKPGSAVSGEAAAALAAAALVFSTTDPQYAATCLTHAKQLYNFAETTKSDSGYTAANGYYNSWSGFYDELSWAAVWIYLASNDASYLTKAEDYVANWGTEPQSTTISYKWVHNWDDVHYGAQLLLAKITGKTIYKESVERNLDWWTTGYNGEKITYTPKGLAWLQQWGSLRYATTQAFLAGVYAEWSGCSTAKAAIYNNFAKTQVDYALGSTGRSFVVGFGTNPPTRPHHRTAHSSWADSQTVPAYHRHTLYGALVGGPGSSDEYSDDISNYQTNEVACDYNAGFIGALAKQYKQYGGTPVANFKAIETKTNDEFFVEAGINASGSNFIEIKALLNNKSGWPAKVGDKLSFKYFIDISEAINAGYKASDITITTNYNAGGKVSSLQAWDASKNIYYVNVDFTGTKIYPGGQSAYKKEIQFRISGPQNTSFWSNLNDYSFTELSGVTSGSVKQTSYIPVYDNGNLVYGNEPIPVNNSGITPTTAAFDKNVSKQADIGVTMTLNGNTLSAIKNGTTALTAGTDYTVSGNSVTILKSYLAKQSVGSINLTFDFSAGTDPVLAVTVSDTTPGGVINPTTAAFDKNVSKQADITVTMTLNGNTLSAIRNGTAALSAGIDYTVSDNTVTILKGYLVNQPVGTVNLTFDFSSGTDPVLAVTVSDSTPGAAISPTTATFDKNVSNQADIAVTIALNGNTLSAIQNGTSALTAGTDYTVSENTVTILKNYLAGQPVGTARLTFDVSSGTDPVLTITITDSSAPVGNLSLQFYNSNTASQSNQIYTRYLLKNTGTTSVDLSKVKIRYYYTIDGEKAQNFWCDWSSVGSSNVTGNFVKMSDSKTGADYYLEIGFNSGAGTLAAGQSLEIQGRNAKSDWTNYLQTDDYSFNSSASSYSSWDKVTVYLSDSLISGVEP